LEQKSNLEQKP